MRQWFRFVWQGLSWVTPWVLRLTLVLMRGIGQTLVRLARTYPQAVSHLAYQWMSQAARDGVPSEYEAWVYWPAAILSAVILAATWVLAALVTVGLLSLVF